MKITTTSLGEAVLVRVEGIVDRFSAGQLYDMLVYLPAEGHHKIILDLSGVRTVTRAGVRGVIVAARLLQNVRGMLRICGASPATAARLHSLGYDHLLGYDETVRDALEKLFPDLFGHRGQEAGPTHRRSLPAADAVMRLSA